MDTRRWIRKGLEFVRWLVAREALPAAPPADGRRHSVGRIRELWLADDLPAPPSTVELGDTPGFASWLFAMEQLPRSATDQGVASRGRSLVTWLVGRERLPDDPSGLEEDDRGI
jgi:hypothetical protein